MKTWLQDILDALLLRAAAFQRVIQRPDAFLRGLTVIVAVALLTGLPALVTHLVRGFGPEPTVEPGEVQHLLAEALFVVSNGGTTMIHTLAHRRPLVAIPLASDQDRRIRRAVRLQIAATATRTRSSDGVRRMLSTRAGPASRACSSAARAERTSARCCVICVFRR
jgi:hypothetical protein